MYTLSGTLKDVFESDFAQFVFNEKRLGIAQLEIVGSDEFLDKNFPEVQKALADLKRERNLDYIFLSIVDIVVGKNIFVCFEESTILLIEEALQVTFAKNTVQKDGIMMRKTITPLLKEMIQ